MGLKHSYKSLKADPADSTIIGATKWNDDHYLLDSSGAAIGSLGDLSYRGVDGLVTLLAGAQGLLYSAGSGNVPAYTMTPTVTSVTMTTLVVGAVSIDATDIGKIDGITNGTVAASKAVVVDANKDIATFRNLTMSGALIVSGAGPHGIGATPTTAFSLRIGGAFTGPAGGDTYGVYVGHTLTGDGAGNIYGTRFDTNFIEAGSGSHALIATVAIRGNAPSAGAATVTNTASLYIESTIGATVSGINYALWVDAGDSRLDGRVVTGGVAPDNRYSVFIDPTFTPTTGSNAAVLRTRGSMTLGTVGVDAAQARFELAGITTAGSGTHGLIAGVDLRSFTVTNAGATVTNTATLYIAAAPAATVSGANYSLWVDAGVSRFDGDIQTQALIALGGGAAPTLGTIGGSGPATAAQNSWARFLDASGVAYWVPVWK